MTQLLSRRHRSLFDLLFGEARELERRRRRRYLALAALVCGSAGVAVTQTDGGKSSPAAIASAKPVGLRAVGVVDVGGGPQALLATADSLWIATPTSVVRLNLRKGSKIARTPIPTNGVDAGLAFGAGSIWLAPTGSSQLLRIDPSNNRVIANIHLGGQRNGRLASLGGGVAFLYGRIWVSRDSNGPRGDVVPVNPTTNQAAAAPITVGSGPDTLVSAFRSIWVDNTSVVIGKNAPSRPIRRYHESIHEPAARSPSRSRERQRPGSDRYGSSKPAQDPTTQQSSVSTQPPEKLSP